MICESIYPHLEKNSRSTAQFLGIFATLTLSGIFMKEKKFRYGQYW